MRTRTIESEAHRGESKKEELIRRVEAALEKWKVDHEAFLDVAGAEAQLYKEVGLDVRPFHISAAAHAAKEIQLKRLLLRLKGNEYSVSEVEKALRDLESGSA